MAIRNGQGRAGLTRGVADFVIALGLFWVAAIGIGGHAPAYAVPLTTIGKTAAQFDSPATRATLYAVATDRVLHATASSRAARPQALFLLSITVAGLVAFNLAIWRHLRRVYASPRRGVWRRG